MDKGFALLMPIIIAILIVLTGIGGYYYTKANDNETQPELVEKNMQGTSPTNATPEISSPPPNEQSEVDDIKILKATLTDVTGGSSTGTARLSRNRGSLFHQVSADLPTPSGNNFYEGWLVQKSPLRFISTGELELVESGGYQVNYSSDHDFPTYDFVVITLETTRDETPERHILEGTPI